ncbi:MULTISPECIES: class I SAM-dependent methyltransferase [unclassified Mycobacterium]|uniref:class I SAM-dependent methyltransferase n=1 Tax=unclassified Mycobacterium TaxID=2642494 RepID=UPI00073FACB6|nr:MULTISPECIES: class I SAM-dependent methyltransferase [unclassified Mycobacterium]KUH82331.1 ubiquinone biosynthesis protein [Mycobacterium sp. GA-0227b]KUH88993.1 ubiquinone biosynthesis protein [Mycobacterium sp. GA-1999]
MADLRENWAGRFGKLGGGAYDFAVQREWLARPAGRVLWGTDTRLLRDSLRAVADLPDGSAVLDIPCGGGLALRELCANQRLRYVAADISPAMLDRARHRAAAMGHDAIEFIEADIERMPFDDKEFDVCLCFNGLHCLPDPPSAVQEITRCLKQGGRLVGDTVIRGAGPRQDLAIAAFRRGGIFGPGGTADDVRDWLTHAGLRIEKLQQSGGIVHFAATRDVS